MNHVTRSAAIAAAIVALSLPAAAQNAPLRMLVSNGMKAVVEELQPQCERAIGRPLSIQFASTTDLMKRIDAGEAFDLAVLTSDAIEQLVKSGKVAPKATPLARSGVGVGIRTGAAKPEIGTPQAMKLTLLKAKSVTYAEDGASRVFVEKMEERLGIANEVKAKTMLTHGSGAATASVADGKAELVLTLASEILPAHGIELVGLLPEGLRGYTNLAAGVAANTKNADAAQGVIRFLTGPAAAPVYKAKGMEAASPAASEKGQAPDWAYGYLKALGPNDPVAPPCAATAKPFPDCAYAGAPTPDDGIKRELPGAPAKFTRSQAYFDYGPADWYPGDHPTMPDIVAHGRQSAGVRACALCHFPNGQGKMENGGVAGLPASYILEQLKAFKSGARRSADPRKANTNEMAQIASLLTDYETAAAANYFASMKWRPWAKVVEAEMAPAVRSTTNGLFLPVAGAASIPLDNRIIEVPENPEHTDVMRDPRSGFIAYVPPGSIARGQALATGKTTRCGLCHGPDLKGTDKVPGIAGRTASYLMRQLWDIHQGARKSQTMAPLVAKLEVADMTDLAAYVASLAP